MERWAIDLTGPHPRSRNGKVYILAAIDCFTRFVEAVAIANKEATTVTRALVENVFCRYGVTLQLISDQAKEFDNVLLLELCRLLGVGNIRTSAYKASTNGCIERFHCTEFSDRPRCYRQPARMGRDSAVCHDCIPLNSSRLNGS